MSPRVQRAFRYMEFGRGFWDPTGLGHTQRVWKSHLDKRVTLAVGRQLLLSDDDAQLVASETKFKGSDFPVN